MNLVCRRSTCNIGHFVEIWELSGRSTPTPSDKWGARSARPWDKGGGGGLQKIFQISRICGAISSLVFKNHVQNLHLCKFKTLLLAVWMDLVPVKSWKNRGTENHRRTKLTGVQLPEACRATKTRSASTATGNFCSHMSQQCSSSKYYNVKPFISHYFSTMYFSETERKKNWNSIKAGFAIVGIFLLYLMNAI